MKQYFKLTLPGQKKPVRISSPVSIGSSSYCDVVLNTDAIADCAFLLTANGEDFDFLDARQLKRISKAQVKFLSLGIQGPILGDVDQVKTDRLFLVREEAQIIKNQLLKVFNTCKKILWVGKSRMHRVLVGTSFAIGVLGIALILFPSRKEESPPTVVNLPFGITLDAGIGAVGNHRTFDSGFEVQTQLPPERDRHDHVLSFYAKGLDKPGEIIIEMNGQQVYASGTEENCIQYFCQQLVPLKTSESAKGPVFLKVVHRAVGSDYLIRNLLFQNRIEAKPADIEIIKRKLETVEGLFAERSLNNKSLVKAKILADKLQLFAKVHAGVDDLDARIDALTLEINKTYTAAIEDLWFSVRKNWELKNFSETREQAEQLLHFYPDSQSNDHQTLKTILKKTEVGNEI